MVKISRVARAFTAERIGLSAGACCRKNDGNAPVSCASGVLGCLDDACCVGPFGIGLPDAAAATALVAAKKAWDAGGDADAFARAKVKILSG